MTYAPQVETSHLCQAQTVEFIFILRCDKAHALDTTSKSQQFVSLRQHAAHTMLISTIMVYQDTRQS